MTQALLDLAAKVEALTGPDEAIDRLVALMTGWHCLSHDYGPCGGHWVSPENWMLKSSFDWWVSQPDAPAYTASLDAAMTLVPEGWGWLLSNRAPKPYAGRAYLNNRELHFTGISDRRNPSYRGVELKAATPAIALTAAALRARASMKESGHD